MWFDGENGNDIVAQVLQSELDIESVKCFKRYIIEVANVSHSYVDNEVNTREICNGFSEYIRGIYTEFAAQFKDI